MEEHNYYTLSTTTLRLCIDEIGQVTEFTDIATGINWAERDRYFAYLLPGTKDNDGNTKQPEALIISA